MTGLSNSIYKFAHQIEDGEADCLSSDDRELSERFEIASEGVIYSDRDILRLATERLEIEHNMHFTKHKLRGMGCEFSMMVPDVIDDGLFELDDPELMSIYFLDPFEISMPEHGFSCPEFRHWMDHGSQIADTCIANNCKTIVIDGIKTSDKFKRFRSLSLNGNLKGFLCDHHKKEFDHQGEGIIDDRWLKIIADFSDSVEKRAKEIAIDNLLRKSEKIESINPKEGDIYLIRELNQGTVKIGRSLDYRDRLKTFSVKLPFKIKAEHVFRCHDYIGAEKRLHDLFADSRIDGEWFDLTVSDIEKIKDDLFLASIGIRVVL